MSSTPRGISRGSRTVGGVTVQVTELVWPDERRSFEVHLGDVDLTENGCFDDPPTDAQIQNLLNDYHGPIKPINATTHPDLLRYLLSTASAQVDWQVDLDQLPVTCAHTPRLVVDLIDVSASHLAALATHAALTEAAQSIQTVITAAEPGPVDWFAAALLGAVAHEALHTDSLRTRTRRALIAALRALQEEDAAWPPEPISADPAPTGPTEPNPGPDVDAGPAEPHQRPAT